MPGVPDNNHVIGHGGKPFLSCDSGSNVSTRSLRLNLPRRREDPGLLVRLLFQGLFRFILQEMNVFRHILDCSV